MIETLKKQRLFFISLIGIVVVSLIMTATFAYQTLQVEEPVGSKSGLTLNIGALDVTFTKTNKINITNMPLLPDYKTADYVEITLDKSDTTGDVAYSINLTNLIYSGALVTEDFKYTITTVNDNYESVISNGNFSDLTGNNISLSFILGRYRELPNTETIRLYLWLQETNANQNDLENTTFKANVEIVSMYLDDINEKFFTDLKIYGNSVQGTIPTPEVPAEIQTLGDYDSETGKYIVPLKLSSKNIINYKTVKQRTDNVVTLIDNGFNVKGKWGAIISDIKVKPNTDYYLQYDSENITGTLKNVIVFANSSTNFRISSFATLNGGTFNTGEYDSIQIWFYAANNSDEGERNITNLQLTEGTTASEYEAYVEPANISILLDEPLRKVGNYTDYIDLKNSVVVRNIGKEVYDENTTFEKNASTFFYEEGITTAFSKSIPTNALSNVWGMECMTNLFGYKPSNELVKTEPYISGNSNEMVFAFNNSLVSDLTGLSNYLNTTNMEIIYKLNAPTYEVLEYNDIPFINNAKIEVCSSNNICASNIEIETNR